MNRWENSQEAQDIQLDASVTLEGDNKIQFERFLSKVSELTPENSIKKITFFMQANAYVLEFHIRHFSNQYSFSVCQQSLEKTMDAAMEELEVYLTAWRNSRFQKTPATLDQI